MEVLAKGIDISSYQDEIDFDKVKAAGYSYVIIKAGEGLRQMGTFRGKYLPAVLVAGLDWGAYWWSNAETVDEAKQEAQAFLKALEGLRPTYPAYLDQEFASPCGQWGVGKGRQLRTDMAKAFLQTLQDAGYFAGMYASQSWFLNWVYDDQLTGFAHWVAQYAPKCTYTGAYGMWQHHGDLPGYVGRCDGISVPVDLNDCYEDYPRIIKTAGLNGWDKPPVSQEESVPRTKYDALQQRYDALAGHCGGLEADLLAVLKRHGVLQNG